jgi:putative ABC transport system permease protein
VAAVPGVLSVGMTNISPLRGGTTAQEMTIDGYVPSGPDDALFADWRAVSGGFFRAMTLPLVRGRTFTDAEDLAGGQVVIVSETLARRYWPNQDPIGRRLAPGRNTSRWLTVIGVARDMRDTRLERDPQPVVFFPGGLVAWPSTTIVAKTQGGVDGVAAAIRRELIALDKTIPVPDPYPLTQNSDRAMATPRFRTLLMGLFASIALVLAAIGVYGVTAYAVALRTREIGVRMALGAEPGQMVRLIAGRGLLLAMAGIVAGSFGAFLLSGFIESLLFGTRPVDARSHLVVAAVLLIVALVSIVIPARRASRIDPRQALIAE